MTVKNEYGKLRSVLLCTPVHFALQPINVIAEGFIREGALPNQAKVLREHEGFAQVLAETGVEIVWVDPHPKFPYQVFTRDVGVTTPRGVLLGTFRESVRHGEEACAEIALNGHVPMWGRVEPGPGIAFEGGDYMYIDERHVALGSGARTTLAAVERLRSFEAELDVEIIPVQFDPKFLHLDMIFCILGERVCTICKEALPDSFLKRVKSWGFETIEVPPEGVFQLNCNLLALDEGIVLSPARNSEVNARLKAFGFEVVEVELAELLKGGGGPHCMSFPIKRD
jgi:N-dimethylarginine dimethylaminohydrolase